MSARAPSACGRSRSTSCSCAASPTAAHGLAAASLHLLWGRWASGGRGLRLDVVYVPLRDWTVPWACAVAAEVGVAALAQAVAGGRS